MTHPLPTTQQQTSIATWPSTMVATTLQCAPIRKRGAYTTLAGPKIVETSPAAYTESCLHQESPSTDLPSPETKKPRKRRSKPKSAEYPPVPLENLRWLTISQTAKRYQVHTEKALRHLVAQAEAYAKHPKSGLRSNGFLTCFIRPAGQRKIIVISNKYEEWLSSFSSGAQS